VPCQGYLLQDELVLRPSPVAMVRHFRRVLRVMIVVEALVLRDGPLSVRSVLGPAWHRARDEFVTPSLAHAMVTFPEVSLSLVQAAE